jgi:hypothetical protein
MNLQQICRAVISAFVLIQELTRRAEILVYLHLPSGFLAVSLGVYRLTACKQMSLSPPLPKGRGRGIHIHAPLTLEQMVFLDVKIGTDRFLQGRYGWVFPTL